MRFRWLGGVLALVLLVSSSTTWSQRPTRDDIERQFLYGWSKSATLIFSGTVARVEYQDDPRSRGPQVEVLARVDAVQRGDPENSLVRIIIEDELQAYGWASGADRVGERGIWFLFRVRKAEGREPRGYLVRYIDEEEIQQDPSFLSELMRFVIQDSVDSLIKPNVLNMLSLDRDSRETAAIRIDMKYDRNGRLTDIEVVERSENALFNDHVFDAVMELHRRIRIPGGIRETQIVIRRSML